MKKCPVIRNRCEKENCWKTLMNRNYKVEMENIAFKIVNLQK